MQTCSRIFALKNWCLKRVHRIRRRRFDCELNLSEVSEKFPDLRDRYLYFNHYFWNRAPSWLRDHRTFFSKKNRGFGEDAFHAMWYFLFRDLKPKTVLEIGVYRGQVVSLWSLLAKKWGVKIEIHGISPFTAVGDTVSLYSSGLDYYKDTLFNFSQFGLKEPILHSGFSTDPSMLNVIASRKWDLIYIDGNHDYEVAIKDVSVCVKALNLGGVLVLDDASLDTSYKPFPYSSAGHPGPSKIANNMNRNEFAELLSVGHNRAFQKIKVL